MDDSRRRESDGEEEKSPEKKAVDNPWSLLATLHGAPGNSPDERWGRNRRDNLIERLAGPRHRAVHDIARGDGIFQRRSGVSAVRQKTSAASSPATSTRAAVASAKEPMNAAAR
jgi:hypothetical protein